MVSEESRLKQKLKHARTTDGPVQRDCLSLAAFSDIVARETKKSPFGLTKHGTTTAGIIDKRLLFEYHVINGTAYN